MKSVFNKFLFQIKKLSSVIRDTCAASVFTFRISWSASPMITLFNLFTEFLNAFLPLISVLIWKTIIEYMVITYNNGQVDSRLPFLLVVYIVINFLHGLINSCYMAVGKQLGMKTQQVLNIKLMDKVSRLPCEFFADPHNADMLNAVEQYKHSVSTDTSHGFDLVFHVISFVEGLFLFIPYNPVLGVIYILTFVPGAVYRYKAQSKMDYYSIESIPESRVKGYLKSILTGAEYAKELRIYNSAVHIKREYDKSWDKLRREREKIFMVNTKQTFLAEMFSNLGLITVILWTACKVFAGDMDISTLTVYIGLAGTVSGKFNTMTFLVPYYVNFTVPRILKFRNFTELCEVNCDDCGIEYSSTELPEIVFNNVSFKYPGSDSYALKNLNLTIKKGEKLALVGENGSGKSTVVKLLLRFYDATEGSILLDGKDIRLYSRKSVRNLFGVYFQEINKYSMTLGENISVSQPELNRDTEYIKSAAKKSGADELFSRSVGLNMELTRIFSSDGYEPSEGQWQKIALARTFFRKCRFLILDEPSSSLDPEAEAHIMNIFTELCSAKGGIIISHRLSSVSTADRVILLENGTVTESGTHAELIKSGKKYYEMYTLQANQYREVRE